MVDNNGDLKFDFGIEIETKHCKSTFQIMDNPIQPDIITLCVTIIERDREFFMAEDLR